VIFDDYHVLKYILNVYFITYKFLVIFNYLKLNTVRCSLNILLYFNLIFFFTLLSLTNKYSYSTPRGFFSV